MEKFFCFEWQANKPGSLPMAWPLLERKEMLLHVIIKGIFLTCSDHFEDGTGLFKQIEKLGMEGIIAKHKESVYQPVQRSKDWLKIKVSKRRDVSWGWRK